MTKKSPSSVAFPLREEFRQSLGGGRVAAHHDLADAFETADQRPAGFLWRPRKCDNAAACHPKVERGGEKFVAMKMRAAKWRRIIVSRQPLHRLGVPSERDG